MRCVENDPHIVGEPEDGKNGGKLQDGLPSHTLLLPCVLSPAINLRQSQVLPFGTFGFVVVFDTGSHYVFLAVL